MAIAANYSHCHHERGQVRAQGLLGPASALLLCHRTQSGGPHDIYPCYTKRKIVSARSVKVNMSKSETKPNHMVIPVNKMWASHLSGAGMKPSSNVAGLAKHPSFDIPKPASIARAWAAVTLGIQDPCAHPVRNCSCVANLNWDPPRVPMYCPPVPPTDSFCVHHCAFSDPARTASKIGRLPANLQVIQINKII